MSSHNKLRVQLEARLADIGQRIGRIETDLRREQDRDWTEQAAELENDEVLEGLDDLGRAEVQDIRATLRRIEEGRYGYCVECRRPIDEERLQAVPTAALCIYCAK